MNEQEFIEIVNQNRALIYKVCNLYCRDPEQRKDLFQEVVLQLWKSFPGFKKQAGHSTWIYRVSLNTAISNFRKSLRQPDGEGLSSLKFEIPDMYETTGEEKRSALHEAIDKLTEIEKAVIMLYLDEKSYEEISEVIGISISNVGVRLSRIKNKLTKLIKTGYEY
ncbi:MAG TPA: sigma-70 family RNA polymerase sigma factor [Chitinophagaceae bacterium]|nr:sigma-70 family RNA polymerase sigma factor [Chitinophagaceae bacterium]